MTNSWKRFIPVTIFATLWLSVMLFGIYLFRSDSVHEEQRNSKHQEQRERETYRKELELKLIKLQIEKLEKEKGSVSSK